MLTNYGSKQRKTISQDVDLEPPFGKRHICAICKRIVTDSGVWEEVDAHVLQSNAYTMSSVVCLECLQKHFPGEYDLIFSGKAMD